jgi:hypothetical protein
MKTFSLISLAIATALAVSPTVVSAQTWDFTFSDSNGVTATGTLTAGGSVAGGGYSITSGTISLTGATDLNLNGTGILVALPASPGGVFYTGGGTELFNFPAPPSGLCCATGLEDAVLFPNQNPQINDSWGDFAFAIGGFNTNTGAGPGAGLLIYSNGLDDYGVFGGVGYESNGDSFEATLVPEGGAPFLYLLLAGAACFGAMFFSPRNGFRSRASA